MESARAGLREAIELYLETWDLPHPRPAEFLQFWTTIEVSC
ncbi:MAG: hypothetical protein ACYDCG_13970 [Candidatus Acidiferrales bacterium]